MEFRQFPQLFPKGKQKEEVNEANEVKMDDAEDNAAEALDSPQAYAESSTAQQRRMMRKDTRKKMAEKYVTITIEMGQEITKLPAVETTTESQASTFPSNNPVELSKDQKGLAREIKKREEAMLRADGMKMQKVPNIMKNQDENSDRYFKPREIAIGPTYAEHKSLRKKELKLRLAAEFRRASGETREALISKIKINIEELKKFFDEKVMKRYDDDRLIRILFLDGCSVLQFMFSYVNYELQKLKINNSQATLIQRDLFLLENQIPFRVLNLLMEMSKKKADLVESIYRFISINVMAPKEVYSKRLESNLKTKSLEDKEPLHLLDLLRSELLFDCGASSPSEHSAPSEHSECKQSFRNIQELKATGIKLKPSDTCSLKDISFSTRWFFWGQLELPALVIDNSTATKLWNLVAYEMCADQDQSVIGVTSYLSFLDSLVDNEEDVKDLRAKFILRNRLSSDAAVAELFNKIGSNLVPDKAYSEVKKQIQEHYDKPWATWMAQFFRDHCSSPWKFLALFAAVIALFLTGAATWYTVWPRNG